MRAAASLRRVAAFLLVLTVTPSVDDVTETAVPGRMPVRLRRRRASYLLTCYRRLPCAWVRTSLRRLPNWRTAST